ncbi:MAG: hypothetical protein J0L88_14880 [Xanthomonadales bacterium]|nr:hypothetical protein [Xanthomonadales bacterium]
MVDPVQTPEGGAGQAFAIPLSNGGPDQLMSAAPGPAGSFHVAGFVAQTVTSARTVVVLRVRADGSLDPSFGTGGMAITPLVFAGGPDEIDVAIQGDKAVISATIANAGNVDDTDVALVRMTATGTVDSTFGVNGVRVVDLNSAFNNGVQLLARDAARALAIDDTGRIYLHAASRSNASATRQDTDFVVVRFTPNGSIDSTWAGGDGKFTLDIAETNASPRSLLALPDGSVIGTGYASTPLVGNTVQPAIYKLTSAGSPDPAFADLGLFHEPVLAMAAEVYGAARNDANLVVTGYGRDGGTANDFLSMRLSTQTGSPDSTYGGAPGGVVLIDPSGASIGSNCRNAIALPGGRVALIGSTGPSNNPAQDAAYVILSANGALDATYGSAVQTFAFGTNGADQLWGGAFNAGKALFVGYKGAGSSQTAQNNDDAWAVLLSTPDDILFRNGFDP